MYDYDVYYDYDIYDEDDYCEDWEDEIYND